MMVKSDKFTQQARVAAYDKRLSAAEFRIYGVLCDRVLGDTNQVTLNRNFLMKAVGCSATTLTTAIKHLMAYGYITSKKRNFDYMTGAEMAPTYYLAAFDEVTAEVDEACEWVFKTKADVVTKEPLSPEIDTPTTEEVIEAPIEEVKEETPVVKKPIKRTLKKTGTQKPTREKPIFTRGYAASPTQLPARGADVTEWSGYDGTALAERDGVRGKLKAGKRVYTILGKKYTFVMQDDGETVNFMASEPTANMLKYDILKYLKVPPYTKDQWKTIINTLRRN